MYQIKLSPYAKVFYIEWLLDPNSYRYNVSADQILYGDLDVERLRTALKRYAAEHLILNSHIEEIDNEPHWVKNDSIFELEFSDHPVTTSELLDYVSRGFDAHKGPLYRFKLVRLEKDVYRFVVVLHHLVVDGSSIDDGLFAAISNYYNDENYSLKYSINEQVELITNLTTTLSDKTERNKIEQKEFWHKQLQDVEPVNLKFLQLEENSETSVEKNNPIGEIRFSYGELELNKINKIKRQYVVTPYIYGMCIFALLLHRYTNQERIAINYPVAIKEGIDFIYGAQVNANLIAYQFDSKTTIEDLFDQSKTFFGALKNRDINHSYYPITNIIKEGSNNHLLNIIFAQPNFEYIPFSFKGIMKVEIQNMFNMETADYFIFEQSLKNHLNFRVRYNKSTIVKELITNLVECYKKLFLEILEDLLNGDDQKPISSYNLLSQDQYQQLIYEFNRTETEYPRDKTIHQLFEEQVLKTPNNIAVVYEDIKLTYQEINNRANQLAHYLLNNYQIKPDDLIVLCLDRSELMIIAILAVLKSGGVYVPIDPKYPDDRINYILNDAKPEIILTNEQHKKRLKKINEKIITIIPDSKNLQKQKKINPIIKIKSDSLVYVIYTSGTTGEPKGVQIVHSNLVNFLIAMQSFFPLQNSDSFFSTTTITFDIVGLEIYLPLIKGAKVVVVDELVITNPKALIMLIEQEKITHMQATPSLWSLLVENGWGGSKKLTLLSGGEKLPQNLAKALLFKSKALWNLYGPTETTIWSTAIQIQLNDILSIGKPIANTQLFVLDIYKNLLPIGAIGELYIGGEGLARGYLNKPELTAERFIPNPFQTEEEKLQNRNSRLYKTGDLVRWLPDGNLEYIGRNDFQVKIRGFRIELGEIENKLVSYPEIKQAAVLVKEHANDKYLAAYYVSDTKLDESKIQEYLATKLPEYMLPNIFIHLDKMQLTINGKLDRKALPEPKFIDSEDYIAPQNEQEQFVCESFNKILGLEKISINADFFKLGGNSLKAISMVSILQTKLDVNVPDIFNLRTPKKIAANCKFGNNFLIQRLEQLKLTYKDKPQKKEIADPKLKQKIADYLSNIPVLDVIPTQARIHKNCNSKTSQPCELDAGMTIIKKPIANVLLTGVTGFLGANLLNQLLKMTDYKIYLLVRADSKEEAYTRVNKKFQFYFDKNLDEIYNSRVFVLNADLEKTDLDLSPQDYQRLTETIDSVIHSAALVKHYGEYEKFYAANVKATINLLELTKQTKLKDFHYISTSSVLTHGFIPDKEEDVGTEDDVPENVESYYNVYVKTKLQGEHQVIKYRDYGINSNIYRVGNLAFIAENCRVQENIADNAFFISLKCLFEMQRIFPDFDMATITQIDLLVELQAIDYTAQAIIKLFAQKELENQIYHVFSNNRFDLYKVLGKQRSAAAQISGIDKFVNNIIYCLNNRNYRDLIVRFLLHQGWLNEQNINNSEIKTLQDRTQHILKYLDFKWPPAESEAFNRYIDLLKNYKL